MNELIDDIIATLTGATIDGEAIPIEDMPVDQLDADTWIEVFPISQQEDIQTGGHPESVAGALNVAIVAKTKRAVGWRTKVIALAGAAKHAWLSNAAMVKKWSQPEELRTEYAIEDGSTVVVGASIFLTYQHRTEYPPVVDGEFFYSTHTIRISGESL